MTDTPQVLLAHHLKTLKLPTFLREYDKLARQCATEGADHVRYLVRLTELELIDRDVNGGAKMPHAMRPGGPVAAAQKCATYGPLSVLARGGGCTAWSSMRRFGWRLSMRG